MRPRREWDYASEEFLDVPTDDQGFLWIFRKLEDLLERESILCLVVESSPLRVLICTVEGDGEYGRFVGFDSDWFESAGEIKLFLHYCQSSSYASDGLIHWCKLVAVATIHDTKVNVE
jgi:hypothetical protein